MAAGGIVSPGPADIICPAQPDELLRIWATKAELSASNWQELEPPILSLVRIPPLILMMISLTLNPQPECSIINSLSSSRPTELQGLIISANTDGQVVQE